MLDAFVAARLAGRRVLVVEDDWLQAQDIAATLQEKGAQVMGPVPSVGEALALLLRGLPDLAVLDVRLGQERVFPLVEALGTLGVPFVLASGSPGWSLPEPYGALPLCEKPLDPGELLRKLAALRPAD